MLGKISLSSLKGKLSKLKKKLANKTENLDEGELKKVALGYKNMQSHATELAELARQGKQAVKKLVAYDKKIKPGYVAGKDAKQDKLVQARNQLVIDLYSIEHRVETKFGENYKRDLEQVAAFLETLN